ncbi:DUF5753 domain-containing protein, partial [Actinophytocola sp.]|uniref:DUF5753 domain-containing protein n=1 Tax=Actinophytocola sp. TaxID=1872138 RepID=UPI00389AFAC1
FTRMAESKQGYYLSDKRIDGSLQSLIFHESSAEHILCYESQVIPGLLQTPGYARARNIALLPEATEERTAAAVRTRMERRQILLLPDPAQFTFFIHEQALRIQVGTGQIMHEQLLHLVLTATLKNVTVRIVPNAAGAFGDAFRVMEFQEHRSIVYLDSLWIGGLILDDPHHVESYSKLVSVLDAVALDEGQSLEFAARIADAYDRGSQGHVTDVVAQEQLQQQRGDGLRGGGVAEEQPQPRRGNGLRGGGLVEPPTPIYE